jgi:hypothetical protein
MNKYTKGYDLIYYESQHYHNVSCLIVLLLPLQTQQECHLRSRIFVQKLATVAILIGLERPEVTLVEQL